MSDEVLYSADVLNVCSKCEEADGTHLGVKERLEGLEVKLNQETRAVLFFTEIIRNCFSVILKTTFNGNFSYEGGMFIGKQAYFQFTLEGDQPKICSRMILDTH